MSEISVLCPQTGGKEYKRLREALYYRVVEKVIQHIVARRSSRDLLLEVYLAGLWHGSELARQHFGATIDERLALCDAGLEP